MPGNTNWSKGTKGEYADMEDLLNNATPEQHADFSRELRSGIGVVDARQSVYGGSGPLMSFVRTNERWFGAQQNPMWLWDCTVTPEQIQEVMREAYARVADLLGDNADNRIEFWIQCGHARFRMLLTWPSAIRECAQDWEQRPQPETGELIRLWVHIPFNSGYNTPTAAEAAAAQLRRAELIVAVANGASPATVMSLNDVKTIAFGTDHGIPIWQNTPLAVANGGPPNGSPSVVFVPNVDEPLAWHLGVPPSEVPTPISSRNAPGLEFSWPGATDGALIPNPGPYAGHTNQPLKP